MKILAFDTSSAACSIALQNGNQIKCLHKVAPLQQGRLILPMIKSLLSSCSVKLNQLDAIAYGCGPGSFTGVRIASSVAQGLGAVTKLPIIAVSSLAALAQTAFLEQQWPHLLVALDARMEQIYWAIYIANNQGSVELVGQERALAPEETNLPDNEQTWYGIGDGWEKYKATLMKHQPLAIQSTQLPKAEALLELAKIKFKQGDFTSACHAHPVYLR